MGKPSYKECVERAFKPFVEAANAGTLASKLFTQRLPSDVAPEQFKRFKGFVAKDCPPLFLPNGGFFIAFENDGVTNFAFSSFLEFDDLSDHLSGWLSENEAYLEGVDPALFLFLSYHAIGFFRLRPEYERRKSAAEIVEIVDFEPYEGHDIFDLISYFRPAYSIVLPADSVLISSDLYTVAAEILALVPNLRSPIIDSEFAGELHRLLAFPEVNSENIFLALSSTMWRYVYLELFRILESVLYVPWMVELNGELGVGCKLNATYAAVRSSLKWREGKRDSIEKLFNEFEDDAELEAAERKVTKFEDLVNSEEAKRSSIGRRIYKLRNQLVHPEDIEDGSIIDATEDEIREACLYQITFLRKVFDRYGLALRDHP